jgi:cyclase
MTTAHVPEHAEIPPPSIEEVAPGVYAWVQLDGSWGLNNTGFIAGERSVCVIDTCFTEARSRAFREAIASVTDRPLRTLINTHHHGDHTHGNYIFYPEAAIVGHERCRQEVLATGHSTSAVFPGVDWGRIEVEPPFITFEDRASVYVDGLRVELIYMGPAHTSNDIVAWLPEQRVLYSGDLAFNGGTPFMMMGSIEGSIRAVERMRELGAERIVPGHGAVCGPEVFDTMEAYARFILETARRGKEAGTPPLELARQADLGPFEHLLDPERIVGNLHRAYAELDGTPGGDPINVAKAFGEMIEYNGGQPVRCLA